jgi:putative ABC transport system permease protein
MFLKLIKTALISLRKNRLRSLLTSLGIIIGVGAVIIMSAIGTGSQMLIKQQIDALGTNILIVFPGGSHTSGVHRGAGSLNRFTFADVEQIIDEATLVTAVTPVIRSGGQIIGGGSNWNSEILGVSTDYFKIRSWEAEYGQRFTENDIRSRKKVALLGKTVADALFPDQDPSGEKIRIRNVPFTVLGVLEEKGQTGVGQDQDDIVVAPATTVLHRLKGGRYVDMIQASAMSIEQIEAAEEELRSILRDAHRLNEGEDDDFDIHNQTEITNTVTSTSKTLTTLLAAIASVSLLVGGIGIMNIMLVSVTERTREIGIRLSVGAREKDILLQFMTEAIFLSIVGGFAGILLSLIFSQLLNAFTSYYSVIQYHMVFLAFLFSAVVGITFGFIPPAKPPQ